MTSQPTVQGYIINHFNLLPFGLLGEHVDTHLHAPDGVHVVINNLHFTVLEFFDIKQIIYNDLK